MKISYAQYKFGILMITTCHRAAFSPWRWAQNLRKWVPIAGNVFEFKLVLILCEQVWVNICTYPPQGVVKQLPCSHGIHAQFWCFFTEEEEEVIPLTPVQELLKNLNPINTDEWGDMKIYEKAYEIFKV